MDISFDSKNAARGAFRTSLPGLVIKISGYPEPHNVKDFSVNGLAFASGKDKFEVDSQFEIDFILGKKVILSGLVVKVVRDIGKGLIGCVFVDLNKYQEERLDKLVLEVQKRMILLRKQKGVSA
ncbi:PilZ domain-containing protein [Maridesulfovibrio hydrothermalis]|uniref:Type IV pilus assembly PilZ n=1 Tax=Maridesulfovibrio hydrothermalis AM13 = DSM 14728 TaxID=1121451 RepID=L0R7G3_9BACT|nr:PilZ domain-containing protein [Maridesulfovibrio hydrothermalis]CCO22157.1 Type IV pilus assembly PilZ [Maridesulfovibrio hydrothermalis AM13 = DSM 14728]